MITAYLRRMNSPDDVLYRIEARAVGQALLLLAVALALGLFTTDSYIAVLGFDYLDHGNQLVRHLAIMKGHGGDPWQYRVLAPYLLKSVIGIFELCNVPRPAAQAFLYFRVWQDTCVLLLAYAYYRQLGLTQAAAVLGMGLLAWGMSYSHYDSDLQFSTFFDVMFYLAAGLCILRGWWRWIVPLTVLAALNRESSGFIPLLLLAVGYVATPASRWRQALPSAALALALYFAVFIGLRLLYGAQESLLPYDHRPGIDMLLYNVGRLVTWRQLLASLSVIPLIAVYGYRQWPRPLKALFWTLVPCWFAIHALVAVLAESRLLLVPQALVLIPAALFACGMLSTALPPAPVRSHRKRKPRLTGDE